MEEVCGCVWWPYRVQPVSHSAQSPVSSMSPRGCSLEDWWQQTCRPGRVGTDNEFMVKTVSYESQLLNLSKSYWLYIDPLPRYECLLDVSKSRRLLVEDSKSCRILLTSCGFIVDSQLFDRNTSRRTHCTKLRHIQYITNTMGVMWLHYRYTNWGLYSIAYTMGLVVQRVDWTVLTSSFMIVGQPTWN